MPQASREAIDIYRQETAMLRLLGWKEPNRLIFLKQMIAASHRALDAVLELSLMDEYDEIWNRHFANYNIDLYKALPAA